MVDSFGHAVVEGPEFYFTDSTNGFKDADDNRGHSRGALWRGDSENHFAGLHYVGGVDISFKLGGTELITLTWR